MQQNEGSHETLNYPQKTKVQTNASGRLTMLLECITGIAGLVIGVIIARLSCSYNNKRTLDLQTTALFKLCKQVDKLYTASCIFETKLQEVLEKIASIEKDTRLATECNAVNLNAYSSLQTQAHRTVINPDALLEHLRIAMRDHITTKFKEYFGAYLNPALPFTALHLQPGIFTHQYTDVTARR